MNDSDAKLREALDAGKAIDFEREGSVRQMMAQTFRSKLRWMVVFLWVDAIAVCVVGIWSGLGLYHAQELKPLIVYSTVLIISAIFIMLVKVIGWQWMNKYAVMREIKRLELQIASMTQANPTR